MNPRLALTALLPIAAVAGAQAQSTFATFSNNGGVEFTRTLNGFTGGGTIPAFVFGSTTYTDVALTMTDLMVMGSPTVTSAGELGPGILTFKSGDLTILTVNFVSARLRSNGAANTAFNATYAEDDTINFGGQVTGDQTANGFSFALSPKVGVPNVYNASFSAVGNVQAVPEPASMAALGLGALALVRKRRARA
jgi:hypothetical protein